MLTDNEIKSRFESLDGVRIQFLYCDETNIRIIKFLLDNYKSGNIQAKKTFDQNWDTLHSLPMNFIGYHFRLIK